MNDKYIQPDLMHILEIAREDQEIAIEISFSSEDSANMFASLVQQVLFDTTLDLEIGEEDITEKMRAYAMQVAHKGFDPEIKVAGKQVTGRLSTELIREIGQRAESLGVQYIQSQKLGIR